MSRKNLYLFLGSLSLAGYAWLAWNGMGLALYTPIRTFCIFKAVTKLPCPSCGTTRAILFLLHGDPYDSILQNPLGAVLLLALVVTPVWLLTDMLTKKASLYRCYLAMEQILRRKSWVSIPLIVLVIANWFWNIAKFR